MRSNNFLSILGVGLGIKSITKQELNALQNCSSEDWGQLVDLAIKQSVGGVFFDGIQQIYTTHGDLFPKEEWARELKARLFGISLQLETRNKKQIAVMNKVGAYLKKHNCQMMVMKGQACARMYPNPLHRSIGDIDCYLYDDYARGNELIRRTGIHVDESWYKHSEFNIEGETFENHQYFVTTRGGKKYKRLDAKLKELAISGELMSREGCQGQQTMDNSQETTDNSQQSLNSQHSTLNVQYPPVMFNALFLTYHAYIHFVSEGLRLKQVLDWVMFVKMHQKDINWAEFHKTCEDFKLNRFLTVMNAIAVNVFGIERQSEEMNCNSPFTDKVMNSILFDDDYIFNTSEGKWYQRFHIVCNMIKYRWKYRDICQQSIVSQLWTNIVGFMFRTEE